MLFIFLTQLLHAFFHCSFCLSLFCSFFFNFLALLDEAKSDTMFTLLTPFLSGETKRKFESAYTGGTLDTPDSGKVFQYWHCCGSEDPFDPGCTAAPHSSYDD